MEKNSINVDLILDELTTPVNDLIDINEISKKIKKVKNNEISTKIAQSIKIAISKYE